MATHSSILAWKTPWTEEPGRLQSIGSQRVGHDRETSLDLRDYFHVSPAPWLHLTWHVPKCFICGFDQILPRDPTEWRPFSLIRLRFLNAGELEKHKAQAPSRPTPGY